MKVFRYGLAMMFIAVLAAPALAREFDICVDPVTGARLDNVDGSVDGNGMPTFTAGDAFVAVGIIVPGGTIPDGGVASDCSTIAGERSGTFFAQGHIVLGLPAAAPDDLAYVDWQFRIDGKGAIDTTGPVKIAPTYPQTITGATGGLGPAKGQALVTALDATGFQFRLRVPGNSGQGN
jgi:hypothetical protein